MFGNTQKLFCLIESFHLEKESNSRNKVSSEGKRAENSEKGKIGQKQKRPPASTAPLLNAYCWATFKVQFKLFLLQQSTCTHLIIVVSHYTQTNSEQMFSFNLLHNYKFSPPKVHILPEFPAYFLMSDFYGVWLF